MSKIPQDVLEAAERIAARSGESPLGVISRFTKSVEKSEVCLADFFWGDSDISPIKKRTSSHASRLSRRAASRRPASKSKGGVA